MKGIITKNGRKYTLTIKHDGVNLYKETDLYLYEAQDTLRDKKWELDQYMENLKSFPELEGKVVRWVYDDRECKAVVIGCDFHVGITLVDMKDKTRYLTCVRGPLSVQGKKILKQNPTKYNSYLQHFSIAVEAIQRGVYNVETVRERAGSGRGGSGASASSCAFGA